MANPQTIHDLKTGDVVEYKNAHYYLFCDGVNVCSLYDSLEDLQRKQNRRHHIWKNGVNFVRRPETSSGNELDAILSRLTKEEIVYILENGENIKTKLGI